MSILVIGTTGQRERFLALLRAGLGEALGSNLSWRAGGELSFSRYARPGEISGSTPVQRRFFAFLNRVIRDPLNQVRLRLVDDDPQVHMGTWVGQEQVLDLHDIEHIPAHAQAFTSVGVITHEIAERLALERMGFDFGRIPQNNLGAAILAEMDFFVPAHHYALQQEAWVTGWRQIGTARTRLGLLPSATLSPFHAALQRGLQAACVAPDEQDVFLFDPIHPSQRTGQTPPRRRATFVHGQCLRPLSIDEAPIRPGPAGL